MIRLIAIATTFAAMALPSLAADVEALEGYSDFRSPGAVVVDRPMDVIKDQLTAFPDTILEGNPRLEIKSYLDRGDRLVIDVTETGLLDDSVSGINRKYLFTQNEAGKYVLWGYGFRQKCARGGDLDAWTPKPCQ